jgi:acetyl esterase/lipase
LSDQATPLVPATGVGLRDRVLWSLVGAAVRGSLLFSPRPTALLVRRLVAAAGAQTARTLERHAPAGVLALVDERYGGEDDTLMNVVYPEVVTGRLPLLLWVHGGAWVGGSKDELTSYLKIIASEGYIVVAPRYSLTPEHRYPTPIRQMMQALQFLQANAGRYHIDPQRIAIAGDSAGAQIAAQLAALVTTPGYADIVGIAPTVTGAQLRGLILACGAYDIKLANQSSTAAGQRLIKAVIWAYTGKRHFLTDPAAQTWSVTDNLSPAFPPTLLTVGNADPLRPHSELLADKLEALGVDAATLFFPHDHQPPLGHEYQFNLDTSEGQLFLERMHTFLRRHLGTPDTPSQR